MSLVDGASAGATADAKEPPAVGTVGKYKTMNIENMNHCISSSAHFFFTNLWVTYPVDEVALQATVTQREDGVGPVSEKKNNKYWKIIVMTKYIRLLLNAFLCHKLH